ncbi:diaminopimelate epimerase [Helicobacter sp. 11S02596-1]|uniref:diaminopimelate epimerase n=1 Tax=Helicobacter sp. 11S02596-1 TaxID=1476194 RepID=UPI000BA6DF96|nr:diaminopimelate epimerase [Helicobacter sp. 11S02596-1]PAF42368.1 diaminopimelate epimerase [Helicobacter sp. 11S02596-1]
MDKKLILHKYSGSGNDFLITQATKDDRHHNRSVLAKTLCDRHNGIGADGLVVVLPHPSYAYEWEFYNADGSEAKMCGNASRCVAHYAYTEGLAPSHHCFLTQAGVIEVSVQNNIVTSNLGAYKQLEKFQLDGSGFCGDWYHIDTGVPHLVHFVAEKSQLPHAKTPVLSELRKQYNANVNMAFIQKDSQDGTIYLSTYERGVEDITLACGTGMAAVFAVANKYYGIPQTATLIPPSQERLSLSFQGEDILYAGEVKRIAMCIVDQNK